MSKRGLFRAWIAGLAISLTLIWPMTGHAGPAPALAIVLSDTVLAENAARPVPSRIPTSVFAAIPEYRDIVLSPGGQRFAARANIGGKDYIGIYRLDGVGDPWVFELPGSMEFGDYYWAGDERLLMSVAMTVPWGDDEARATRLISAELGAHKTQMLAKIGNNYPLGLKGDDVLWIDPEGKTALVAMQRTIYDYPAVFSVDLATAKATMVVPQRPNIWDWYADTGGVVRYGYGWTDDHHWQMIYRKDADTPFTIVARGTDKDDDAARIARDKSFSMQAGSDEGYAYGVSKSNGLTGIYRYNFAKHEMGDLVFEAPASDVDLARTTNDGRAMFSAYYTDSRDRVKWFDQELAALQVDLDKAVSGAVGDHEVWISSRNRNNTIMAVRVLASNDPGRYYVWQAANGRLQPLTKGRDGLRPADLAVSHYVNYTARDGTAVPAYLTLPPGREAKGLPLIVMPHGGPYGLRDHGDYDGDVQFLANRGYAVLQPQYRGSGSYGKAFEDSGHGQWGRVMQDDIDDGMDWLVKQGIADPLRVCLVGASYGGYAALWGATRNPERYRCAVSFAGISDMPRNLKFQLNSFNDRQAREQWRANVQGDTTFDLRTISPLFNIDRLKVPVMLLHGTADQTVPPKQSKLYADALKAAGRTYEYYEIEGEGHGFSSPANAQLWYDKLDAFLTRYNPAK